MAVNNGAVVTEVDMESVENVGVKAGSLLYVWGSSAEVTWATIRGGYRDGVDYSQGRMVNVDTNGILRNLALIGCVIKKGQWAINASGTTTMLLRASACNLLDASVSIRSVANLVDARIEASDMADLTTVSGGTIRSRGLGTACDVSKLAKNAGDMATNTNGSLSCGTGPVVCNGTNWKHLYTGATY